MLTRASVVGLNPDVMQKGKRVIHGILYMWLPRLNETPRHLPDLTQYVSLPIIDRIKPKDHECDHQCYAES